MKNNANNVNFEDINVKWWIMSLITPLWNMASKHIYFFHEWWKKVLYLQGGFHYLVQSPQKPFFLTTSLNGRVKGSWNHCIQAWKIVMNIQTEHPHAVENHFNVEDKICKLAPSIFQNDELNLKKSPGILPVRKCISCLTAAAEQCSPSQPEQSIQCSLLNLGGT